MVKVVTPAATRTTPVMISIFFSFMGRRYPRPFSTSYVEQAVEVPGFSAQPLGFEERLTAKKGCLPAIGSPGNDEPHVRKVPGCRRWKSVLVPQIWVTRTPPSSGR